MPVDRTIRLWSIAALFASALGLGGCASHDCGHACALASRRTRRNVPKEAGGYLPIHDLPPDRDEAAIKPAELAKIQAELIAARDRQASMAATPKAGKK